MRAACAAIAIFTACFITGCSLYGNAPVYGAFHRVSPADLRAATIAVQKFRHPDKIYAYRVISADEIWLYVTPDADGGYWAARRVNGKWKENGGEIILKEPIDY